MAKENELTVDFKIALVKCNMTMKQFCIQHDFDYQKFNRAINGFTNFPEEYQKAVKDFIHTSK